MEEREGERDKKRERKKAKKGSEVLLEEVQQHNLIMFSRLGTSNAVALIWINLEKQKTTPGSQ